MTCVMCEMVHREAVALRSTIKALTSSYRKIKEIVSRPEDGIVFVICEDGTLWYRGYKWEASREWVALPPVPGGEIKFKDKEPVRAIEGSASNLSDSDATKIHNVQMYQDEDEG